jgi:hypothetical protein
MEHDEIDTGSVKKVKLREELEPGNHRLIRCYFTSTVSLPRMAVENALTRGLLSIWGALVRKQH